MWRFLRHMPLQFGEARLQPDDLGILLFYNLMQRMDRRQGYVLDVDRIEAIIHAQTIGREEVLRHRPQVSDFFRIGDVGPGFDRHCK